MALLVLGDPGRGGLRRVLDTPRRLVGGGAEPRGHLLDGPGGGPGRLDHRRSRPVHDVVNGVSGGVGACRHRRDGGLGLLEELGRTGVDAVPQLVGQVPDARGELGAGPLDPLRDRPAGVGQVGGDHGLGIADP